MTVRRRLRQAIDSWPDGGIAAFQRLVDEPGKDGKIRGTSRASINRYLNGETSPSLEFLELAARTLGVREQWLMTGEGERTPQEEIVTFAPAVVTGPFDEAIVSLKFASSGTVEAGMRELTRRLLASCSDSGRGAPDSSLAASIAQELQELVLAPLRVLDPTFRGEGRERDADYLIATLHALMLAVPARGRGRDTRDLLASIRNHSAAVTQRK